MRFFGLKSCDTCRKALKQLELAGKVPTNIDVRRDGVELGDLEKFVTELGDALINRKSTTWRQLSEQERDSDPLTLLQSNPTLMKRPVIEHDDGSLTVGWTQEVQTRVLP